MKRLSSKSTYFNKRIFPIILWVFIALFLCLGIYLTITRGGRGIAFISAPVFMSFIGFHVMKKYIWDLVDEVYDEGETLLFRNKGKEARVSLKEIRNVVYNVKSNPNRVTLTIRYRTELGEELSFSPPAGWIPFKKNADIEDLTARIDKAGG
jgi:hypothetical protein